MKDQAIALCRVSTPEQKLSNSLNRQEQAVLKTASDLDVEIVKWWSGNVSSKAGTNTKRKDLKQMEEFCKHNKRVKYLIVDEPDRFMRSIDEAFFFEVLFRDLGVTVWYACDPSLNTGDLKAKLLKFSKLLPAEGSNDERIFKSINGHIAAIKQGRYTFPPKPGYKKGTEPGVHIPHPTTYEPLKNAFEDVLSGKYTPLEALKRLNATSFYKVHSPWRMDKFRKYATDPYYAGILVIEKQVIARNEHGRHKAMLTKEQHEELVKVFDGKFKPRGEKKHYNPAFPMNKLMVCGDCGEDVKFTGSKKNNGYKRKTVSYYYKYECRGCHRSYHRFDVHIAVTKRLDEVKYLGNQRKDFLEALEVVWRQKQQDKLQEVNDLQKQLEGLEKTKSSLVIELASSDSSLKEDLRLEIGDVKVKIEDLKDKIQTSSDLDDDLLRFTDFGLNYTDDLVEDWWDLEHDDRVECQQLIFPGGISFNSDKKVGTTLVSPLYTLKPTKKDLSKVEKSLLVELVGTAPTSASLSWLVFYRLSLFEMSRIKTAKQTKRSDSESESLNDA